MRPIGEIAGKLGIPDDELSPYGRYKAKISLDYVRSLADRPNGRLIVVTAITPTPAGEGKTTTTVGLGDAPQRAQHGSGAAETAGIRYGGRRLSIVPAVLVHPPEHPIPPTGGPQPVAARAPDR